MFELDPTRLDQLVSEARRSPRRRLNLNLHSELAAPVQRLAIAMEPDSYVRPHRHASRWELFIVLRGGFDLLIFEADGRLRSRHALGVGQALEYPAGTFHAVLARESGSVFFEVKEGPMVPVAAEDWLPGTPAEGEPGVAATLERFRSLRPGEPARAA